MPATKMALTPDLVALCERTEVDQGALPGLTKLSAEDRIGLREKLVRESLPGPLWIFAYGSLIWNPTFEAVEEQRATAVGWHRSFCLELLNWRGTREQPGLMMALDNGGRCDGLVYRVADEARMSTIDGLLAREVDHHEDLHSIRWVPVKIGERPSRALVFWAGPRGPGVIRRLPLEQVASVLARACGYRGSCAAYLYQTVRKLEEHGIRDRNLWRLQQMVADEIKALHGDRIAAVRLRS